MRLARGQATIGTARITEGHDEDSIRSSMAYGRGLMRTELGMTRLAIPRFSQHLCFIIALVGALAARTSGAFAVDANTAPITGSWLVEDIRGDGVTDLAHFTLTIDNNG